MVYYTYAYLREDRSPYYIGKGKGDRAYRKRYKGIKPPKDKSRILILKQNLTEAEAFRHEVYMINVFGRKDLGTGILHNKTNGGEGSSGAIVSDEWKRKMIENRILSEQSRIKMSKANKGRIKSKEEIQKISESMLKYHYTIYSITEDKTYETTNLKGFSRKHLLDYRHLSKTLTGKRNQHKGFKLLKKESISALP